MLPEMLGSYRIVRQLGKGGMGEVYLAEDTRLGRKVAIKILPAEHVDNPALVRRFTQEARAASSLSHPNIAQIYDIGEQDGIRFIAMEYVEGQPISELVRHGPLETGRLLEIGVQLADALDEAHSKRIIHRDIKPPNILINSRGLVKILDFGLAKWIAASDDTRADTFDAPTEPGVVMGTVDYMSPEQALGRAVDHRSDIFSLGIVLYALATARLPFSGRSASEKLDSILHRDPDAIARFNFTVPPELERIIRKCLAKDPESRYQSAHELRIDLRNLQRELESGRAAATSGVSTVPSGPISRRVAAATPFVRRVVAPSLAAVVLLVVVSVMFLRARPSSVAAQPRIQSMVVMPFENATSDENMEYLSDGITEGVINSVAQLPNVRVVARTTSFRFKGKPLDLAEVRNSLKVDAVLAGRIAALGKGVVVQADLVDAASGTQLWGDRYHEENTALVTIEQQIVRRIAETLRMNLTAADQNRISHVSTKNPEAYKLYLQGRFFWNKRNPEAIEKSKEFFERAIALDPQFALAYSGLADAYELMPPTSETRARAEAAARAAVRLDSNLAEAHASLGLIEADRYHWESAKRELERAVELNPNYATALHWHSAVLVAEGRIDESLRMIQRAAEIDPLSTIVVVNVSQRLLVKGAYPAALAEAQKAQALDPNYVFSYICAGMALEEMGKLEDAAAAYRRAAEVPSSARGTRELSLVFANVALGHVTEARQLARSLEDRAARGQVSLTWAGWAYAVLGDREKAFVWLERALEAREVNLRYYIRMPNMKKLRGYPLYGELLRRLAQGFDD